MQDRPYKNRSADWNGILSIWKSLLLQCINGRLAQLVRAFDSHSRGRGFEPLSGHHFSYFVSALPDLVAKVLHHLYKLLTVVTSIDRHPDLAGIRNIMNVPPKVFTHR